MSNTEDRRIHPDDFDAVVRVLTAGLSQTYEEGHREIMDLMGLTPGITFSITMMKRVAEQVRLESEQQVKEQQNGNQS